MTGSILVLGAGGQVGRAWVSLLGDKAIGFTRADADLSSHDFINMLERKVGNVPLAAVVNAAAYTQVDKAEVEGRAEAMRVNAEAAGELALWCKLKNIPLVHYSTDYVLDGQGSAPFTETAEPVPLNAYGVSKLVGESIIQEIAGDYLIFRTSWVYDARGKNFYTAMLRLFHEKDSVSVVSDQIGAPTYAPQLAAASYEILKRALEPPLFPSGIYHLCHAGDTSWHGFAEAILTLARRHDSGVRCQRVEPILSSGYPTPAIRPRNSRLDCSKVEDSFGVRLPAWESGLTECIKETYENSGLRTAGSQSRPA